MKNDSNTKSYFFIGIGGIGMSGLARILLTDNQQVSGSDTSISEITEALTSAGAIIYKGHQGHNIRSDMIVIYNSQINKDNPEFQEAIKLNCPILHRSDLLQILMQNQKVIAIAGTHGKTTTTSLLTSVLINAGFDPSFAVGGVVPQLKTNAGKGNGAYFVAEADESDGTFLKYKSFGAIVTNIDNDHLDHFINEENIRQSFGEFLGKVEESKHLFWCGDNTHLKSLSPKGCSYGFDSQCNWRIENFQQDEWKIIYDLQGPDALYKNIEVALTGRHNALNSSAVFALAISLQVPENIIRSTFASFGGVKRRCEKKGEYNQILFLDDYGHHPTEIEATLSAIRKAIGDRRLIVAFQPHRYTRTRDCLGTFGNVFDQADQVYITEIYSAGEVPIEGITHDLLLTEVQSHSNVECYNIARKQLAESLAAKLKPYDVLVTLGAGDITKLSQEILSLLK